MSSGGGVLIVVDDDLLARAIARCVSLRFEPRIALGVTAALFELSRRVPDVALVDLHLEGLGGIPLMALLAEGHPGVRRILCTSWPDADGLLVATGVAHAVLSKLAGTRELLAALDCGQSCATE